MFYNMLRTTVSNFRFFERELPAQSVIAAYEDSCVTKRPLDIFSLDQIEAANQFRKQIICIIMVRDIRAIVTSRHENVPDDYFIGFDQQYFIHDGRSSFTNPGVLATHAAIARAWQRRDMGIIALRYEDLVRDTSMTQSRLGDIAGFAYSGQFQDFHSHRTPEDLVRQLNTLRAIDLSAIDAWREPRHRARIRDQFTRCPQLFEILRSYGYEKDDRWFDAYRDESPTP
jgi:hypothetical protein